MSARVGIHDLAVATAGFVLELDDLAVAAGVDPAKYRLGLGQEQMSVPGPDEDVVTMAAAAAAPIVARHGVDRIRTLFFATESGIDQSKAVAEASIATIEDELRQQTVVTIVTRQTAGK